MLPSSGIKIGDSRYCFRPLDIDRMTVGSFDIDKYLVEATEKRKGYAHA